MFRNSIKLLWFSFFFVSCARTKQLFLPVGWVYLLSFDLKCCRIHSLPKRWARLLDHRLRLIEITLWTFRECEAFYRLIKLANKRISHQSFSNERTQMSTDIIHHVGISFFSQYKDAIDYPICFYFYKTFGACPTAFQVLAKLRDRQTCAGWSNMRAHWREGNLRSKLTWISHKRPKRARPPNLNQSQWWSAHLGHSCSDTRQSCFRRSSWSEFAMGTRSDESFMTHNWYVREHSMF